MTRWFIFLVMLFSYISRADCYVETERIEFVPLGPTGKISQTEVRPIRSALADNVPTEAIDGLKEKECPRVVSSIKDIRSGGWKFILKSLQTATKKAKTKGRFLKEVTTTIFDDRSYLIRADVISSEKEVTGALKDKVAECSSFIGADLMKAVYDNYCPGVTYTEDSTIEVLGAINFIVDETENTEVSHYVYLCAQSPTTYVRIDDPTKTNSKPNKDTVRIAAEIFSYGIVTYTDAVIKYESQERGDEDVLERNGNIGFSSGSGSDDRIESTFPDFIVTSATKSYDAELKQHTYERVKNTYYTAMLFPEKKLDFFKALKSYVDAKSKVYVAQKMTIMVYLLAMLASSKANSIIIPAIIVVISYFLDRIQERVLLLLVMQEVYLRVLFSMRNEQGMKTIVYANRVFTVFSFAMNYIVLKSYGILNAGFALMSVQAVYVTVIGLMIRETFSHAFKGQYGKETASYLTAIFGVISSAPTLEIFGDAISTGIYDQNSFSDTLNTTTLITSVVFSGIFLALAMLFPGGRKFWEVSTRLAEYASRMINCGPGGYHLCVASGKFFSDVDAAQSIELLQISIALFIVTTYLWAIGMFTVVERNIRDKNKLPDNASIVHIGLRTLISFSTKNSVIRIQQMGMLLMLFQEPTLMVYMSIFFITLYYATSGAYDVIAKHNAPKLAKEYVKEKKLDAVGFYPIDKVLEMIRRVVKSVRVTFINEQGNKIVHSGQCAVLGSNIVLSAHHIFRKPDAESELVELEFTNHKGQKELTVPGVNMRERIFDQLAPGLDDGISLISWSGKGLTNTPKVMVAKPRVGEGHMLTTKTKSANELKKAIMIPDPNTATLKYTFDTEAGDSGTPIAQAGKIIGIHIGSASEPMGHRNIEYNHAIMITDEVISGIRAAKFELSKEHALTKNFKNMISYGDDWIREKLQSDEQVPMIHTDRKTFENSKKQNFLGMRAEIEAKRRAVVSAQEIRRKQNEDDVEQDDASERQKLIDAEEASLKEHEATQGGAETEEEEK